MLRCRDVVQLIGTDAVATAPWHRRLAVRLHLAMCENCTAYARSLRQLAHAARALAARDAPAKSADADEIARAVRHAAETWGA